MKNLIGILLIVGISNSLFANCIYAGNVYPEGYHLGSSICVNGTWISG